MNIVYYGACWPTNIGNAFIDYGSIYTIKKAMPNSKVFFASELPRWLLGATGKDMDNSIDMAEIMDIDYVVVSGMTLCDEFIITEGPILKKLNERGVKIIFNGCGGASYTRNEIENFRRFLNSIEPVGFITRDEISYKNFKEICQKILNGIDCAFFLSESFIPAKLTIKDFVIFNFDAIEEPKINIENKKILRTNHSFSSVFPNDINLDGIFLEIGINKPRIGLHKRKTLNRILQYKNILISDIPDDYLHLYANASAVYSDRVHTCIATLSFGNMARLYSNTPRSYLFDRVGAYDIKDNLTKLNFEKLNTDKKRQIAFLTEIFKEI